MADTTTQHLWGQATSPPPRQPRLATEACACRDSLVESVVIERDRRGRVVHTRRTKHACRCHAKTLFAGTACPLCREGIHGRLDLRAFR